MAESRASGGEPRRPPAVSADPLRGMRGDDGWRSLTPENNRTVRDWLTWLVITPAWLAVFAALNTARYFAEKV